MKRIVMLIMAVALIALPTMAQNMEFRSTSTMQGSGNYVAPVTAVGANSAVSGATTTESYSPSKAPSGRRKIDTASGNDGGHSDPNSPIGDAWPLAFFALMMAVVTGVKRKMNSKIEKQ